jgi:hypothetical protein
MGGRFKSSSLHHHRSYLRHLDRFAAAILLSARRLVEMGLKVRTPVTPVNKPGPRQRTQELAGNTIEKMIDPAAPPEERAQRKHRLTKGPSEFREDRVDLPKPKR